MKNNMKLAKFTIKYFAAKKFIHLFFFIFISLSFLTFIPIFLSGKNGNYSWIAIIASLFSLGIITIFIFDILFIETKYNQFDLLLLSKTKMIKNIYISKWIASIVILNVFIFANSFIISLMFSIYSGKFAWFIPLFFSSIFILNIIGILFIFLFSLFLLLLKGKILTIIISISTIMVIFIMGVSLKVFSDSKNTEINFRYNNQQTHQYANLYYEKDGKIRKSIIEKTNYQGKIKTPTLYNTNQYINNYNPLNWIVGLELSTLSKQLSSDAIIIDSKFNVNVNNFKLTNNFFKTKPNIKIKGIYPIGVNPLFTLNHFQIEKNFQKLYEQLINKGYDDNGFKVVGNFISTNDFWQNIDPSLKEILFKTMGINGNANLMYWLRDKQTLLNKNPDLFSWMKLNTSEDFSKMVNNLYDSPKSLFNLTNLKNKARNEFISSKIEDENKSPAKRDVDYFKNKIVSFSGTQVRIDEQVFSLSAFTSKFNSVKDFASWKTYVDKNSFTLKQLKEVDSLLNDINTSLPVYNFESNEMSIQDFHYEYLNITTSPIVTTGISIVIMVILIIVIWLINNKMLKKANLKGF